MNNFAAAERWLNQQENVQQNLDNIKRPNTKWVFVKFFNVDVKVKTATFLIKYIKKLATFYMCADCKVCFMQACHL